MKKKFFKWAVILMSVCIMFVVFVSPASAVSYHTTQSSYPYQEECYGSITIYSDKLTIGTYCELSTAGKWARGKHSFINTSGHYDYSYSTNWNTTHTDYSWENTNTFTVNTPSRAVYLFLEARSQHSVQISQDLGVGWYYFDPDLDDSGDTNNPDYHWFIV